MEVNKKKHTMGNELRKEFSKTMKVTLQELAQDTHADRALVFEYSNGSSNLVGLPFLFASATSEVTTPGTAPVADQYQRVNLSMFSGFLSELETAGYVYIDDVSTIRDEYPTLYNFIAPNGVHSALFYAIQGVDEVVGFLVITTVGKKTLDRKCAISDIARVAQLVSSM